MKELLYDAEDITIYKYIGDQADYDWYEVYQMDKHDRIHVGNICKEHQRALADAIYADLGWTLTKDALPPDNTEVLATLGGIPFVERINPNKVQDQDEDAYLPDEFRRTFDRWMLIPPFEKESEE